MATSAPRPSSSSSRRSSSSFNAPTSASIARGATARSAVSHKVNASLNGINRRASIVKAPIPATSQDGDSSSGNEELLAALKKETEEKEELLVRVQDKDQNISELSSENTNLTTALHAAEARLNELYADQARIEEETVARLELVDRLRSQVQELEREKRDILRRYNEQTATFDAERQSFYDNEQHLKSRIQSLAQARKTAEVNRKASSINQEIEENDTVRDELAEEHQSIPETPQANEIQKPTEDDDEPAEMTSLRLELSTLSTSYASLQNTVQHLSSQLLDLKRVNNQLQEENESYNILLREKTISGQFDILRTVGAGDSEEDSGEEATEDALYGKEDESSLRSRTPLDPVDELAEDMDTSVYMDEQADMDLNDKESIDSMGSRERSRGMGRKGRRAPVTSRSPARKGESLADLPVAGPGLDLAAELGRAENQAFLEGKADPADSRDRSVLNSKGKLGKKKSVDQKATLAPPVSPGGDLETLRSEVKSLKDANKALSLYASKIIDRIIAQEGFEHVLAVDYEKSPVSSPTKKTMPPTPKVDAPKKKARPQSAIFGLNFQTSEPTPQASEPPKSPVPQSPATAVPTESSATTRTQRRSMSFDWRSMFGSSSEKKPEINPNLRPLSLRPGAPTVVTARKLETQEDEEDRKERERLNAVMKLMGIEKPQSVPPSPFIGSPSSSTGTPTMIATPPSETMSPKTAAPSRFSFFRSRSNTSETSVNSGNSGQAGPKSSLTAEALERAEAETTLAALDEREKVLSAEIAKGSNGGFTDMPSRRQRTDERRSWRSKRSGESGSGSTVWSAGMSTHREEDSADEGARAQ